jgi:hypothetical protein
MNYKQTAQQLASKGRYGDTMLMHVSPKEVAGLQYLGGKYGTKLTINPSTGLPEAFNFSRFLPMIAGAALAPYTGGASAALIVGGVETARTGNIMKGLQAGLGAYGGANIASGLGTMGAEQGVANATAANLNAANPAAAIGSEGASMSSLPYSPNAVPVVPEVTGSQILAAQQPGQLESFISQQAGGAAPGTEAYRLAGENYATAASEAASQAPANLGTPDFRPTYTDIGKGVQRLGTAEGISSLGSSAMANPMTTAKIAGSALLAAQEEEEPYKKPKLDYSKYPKAEAYKRDFRENPNPYADREFAYYEPNALYVKDGGQTKYNVGGLSGGYTDYMRQLQQMINMKGGADPAMPVQSGNPLQMMASMAKSGEMGKMKSYKTGGLEDGGFVLRASTVNGVGNGSSEAGLKYLQEKLGAVPIKGKGDGMSDSIPTSIEGRRKALVSNEEAYVPRNIVARLGDGDINKGANKLDKFMKRVDKAKTGKPKPPKQINPDNYLPKKKSYA